MDDSDRYELLQKIAGEKIVAFRGRQTSGGQMVLLHQLSGTNDHTDVLKLAVQYLLRSPASAGGRILDLVEIHGLHYIVTLDQPECLALREWLKWELEGPKPAPISPAPTPVRDAGDFARFFQNEPKRVAAPAPPAPPPAAEEHVPGEFTQLFGRGGQSQPGTPAPPMMAPPPVLSPPMAQPAPAPTPPLVSEKPQPGEFTRLFRSPLATPAESPVTSLPTTSPSTRSPGEFTRIFGGGTPAGTNSPPPPASMPASPPPPPPSTPGPLTESLDPRHAPTNRPETAQSASSAPGEFTRVIRGPGGGAAVSPGPPPPPPAPPAAAPPPVAMPVFSTPPLPTVPSAPSAAAPSLPSAPSMPSVSTPQISVVSQTPPMGRPSTALIILFVVLLVAALALIAYVIFRH